MKSKVTAGNEHIVAMLLHFAIGSKVFFAPFFQPSTIEVVNINIH
jgi:hypothetical protein